MRQYLTGLVGNFPRVGVACPSTPANLAEIHVLRLKDGGLWAPTTLRQMLLVLRWFARWAGNPLADRADLWETPGGAPVRRRWLTAEQLAALYNAARGRQRLVVALEGFNGLRRIEVLRLRAKDVDLTVSRPEIHVLGKGKNGGKWRTIPLTPFAYGELIGACHGKSPTDRLYPFHERTADHDIRRASVAAGLGIHVSGHDLRRTFGRLSYEAGVGLVELKYLYGHESVDMTAHYIGLDDRAARAGLARFADGFRGLVDASPQGVAP